ncbi:MAG: glycoside hydrolase family 16 protein [Niabella sp.]|nr:glycoside hydrolase family 16 protein [Niabella sp.]
MMVAGTGAVAAQQTRPKALSGRPTRYKLVWADEFNYNGVPDAQKWSYDSGHGNDGWGNQEWQDYKAGDTSTTYVSNGLLRIQANRTITGTDTVFTSARLKTKQKASWKYGKIEVRAKTAYGLGVCSAIWMMPADDQKNGGWPFCGEIDIMEHIGWESHKDSIFQTVHTGAYNHLKKTQKGMRTYIPRSWQTFHSYVLEWTPEGIDYFIDGLHRYHFPNEHKTMEEWPFDTAFYLIMNISVGGQWEGAFGIDPAIFPAAMFVDYVRVYQMPDHYSN